MADLTRLIRDIRASCPGLTLLENEPLARHCSFRIGGPCAALALPASEEELLDLCRILRQAGQEPLVMGNGTNLLITDAYLPGLPCVWERVFPGRSGGRAMSCTPRAAPPYPSWRSWQPGSGSRGWSLPTVSPGTLGGALVMNRRGPTAGR